MSGGAFDYAQYRIDDIVSRIEREIERATCKRTPLVTKQGVAVYELYENGGKRYCCQYQYKTFESACEYFGSSCRFELVAGCKTEGKTYVRYKDIFTCEVYEVVSYTYEENEPDENGEIPYYPDYSEKTLQEFRRGIELLKKAGVYAQRIDWLICGDDGEDNFHKRLEEDLKGLEEV